LLTKIVLCESAQSAQDNCHYLITLREARLNRVIIHNAKIATNTKETIAILLITLRKAIYTEAEQLIAKLENEMSFTGGCWKFSEIKRALIVMKAILESWSLITLMKRKSHLVFLSQSGLIKAGLKRLLK